MEAWKNFLLKATHSFIQLVLLFSLSTYTYCEYSIDAETLLICAELEPGLVPVLRDFYSSCCQMLWKLQTTHDKTGRQQSGKASWSRQNVE